MAWCIDQVDEIFFAFMGMQHGHRLCLDGDSTFSLDIQLVENLMISSWTLGDGSCHLKESISQGRFAMLERQKAQYHILVRSSMDANTYVDMSDN